MTKILYWNIQQFGNNKINNPNHKRQKGASVSQQAAAAQRRQYIIDTITQQVPDIFVVVETTTGAGNEGQLVTSGGALGARNLLNTIRATPALGATWMLVPPLILGQGGVAEGISVYYNSTNLDFTGPFGWQGGVLPAADPATVPALTPYVAPWNNTLPAGNTPAGGNTINPNTPYRELAGQWLFTDGAAPMPNRLQFPAVGNRPPYLTTFWDAANARTIKLLAYHAPPNFGPAANGTNALSQIREMTTNLAADEAGVIVGDFNVNVFNTHYEPIAYNTLLAPIPGGAGYNRLINPTPVTNFPEKGYVCTHIKTSNKAKPWPVDTPPLPGSDAYPGYGYIGSNPAFPGYDSIDNVLTRYGAAAAGPAANLTIVNRITGTPYTAKAAPANTPTGHYAYTTGMEPYSPAAGPALAGLPIALPLPPNGPGGNGGITPGTIGGLSKFKGWSNFGKIRSTSDHLAIVVDV